MSSSDKKKLVWSKKLGHKATKRLFFQKCQCLACIFISASINALSACDFSNTVATLTVALNVFVLVLFLGSSCTVNDLFKHHRRESCGSYFLRFEMTAFVFLARRSTGPMINLHTSKICSLRSEFKTPVVISSERSFCAKPSETEIHLKNIHEKYEREKQSKRERNDKLRKLTLPAVFLMGTGAVYLIAEKYGKPEVDSVTGVVFEDEFTGQSMSTFRRAWKNIRSDVREFEEPSRKKLLPDPLQKPYIQPKYTVLIELKDLLVHPEWSFETGWRFRKRPGIDFLLETIASHSYEVVIFTSEPGFMAMPVVESLNSKGVIMYSLFRDSTHYKNNVYTKDISRINRDHSRVIILDTSQNKVNPNPQNALVLPPWDGNLADRGLFDLAMFLKAIETTRCSDVRTFLKAYANESDPLETFRQRQLALQQQSSAQKSVPKKTTWSQNLFGSKR